MQLTDKQLEEIIIIAGNNDNFEETIKNYVSTRIKENGRTLKELNNELLYLEENKLSTVMNRLQHMRQIGKDEMLTELSMLFNYSR